MSVVPKLSARIPVYNGSAYVAESIEALLGQTFEDFELIISGNASTDDTGDICRRYEKLDSRIRYRYLAEWVGRRAKPHPLVAAALPVAEAAPSSPVDELVAGRKESLS